MSLKVKSVKAIDEVRELVKSGAPMLFHASKTSTVIPYEKLESVLELENYPEFNLVNVSELPAVCEMDEDLLHVSGGITWKEAKAYCLSKGRNILTSPTEELAAVISGVATSATGERCFGHGTLRDQIEKLRYIDLDGVEKELSSSRKLCEHEFFESPESKALLKEYQKSYIWFADFKNAPFPRLEVETDLMTGTEGQLGLITDLWLKTASDVNISYIFLRLPKWEKDYSGHLEVFEKVQVFRDVIFSCELIDQNSISYLPTEKQIITGSDVIFLEVVSNELERVHADLFLKLNCISEDDIFEIPAEKCRQFRMDIPRYVFEANAQAGVVKMGTDVQVALGQEKKLLDFYRSWTDRGVDYNLFGHFGDAHLHFNFMPSVEQVDKCNELLLGLYDQVAEWRGSPFAEHGVGLIKQKFMMKFYSEVQYKMFEYLKGVMDPKGIFFPQGFMNMEMENN